MYASAQQKHFGSVQVMSYKYEKHNIAGVLLRAEQTHVLCCFADHTGWQACLIGNIPTSINVEEFTLWSEIWIRLDTSTLNHSTRW
jgi:hypothetical protein